MAKKTASETARGAELSAQPLTTPPEESFLAEFWELKARSRANRKQRLKTKIGL